MNNDSEYQKAEIAFRSYFKTAILPVLETIETRRKKYLSSFIVMFSGVVAWIIYILNNLETYLGQQSEWWGLMSCFGVLAACFPMFLYYRTSKENILPLVAGYFGQFNYTYQPLLDEDLLDKSMIMPQSERLTTDDGFEGKYGNIHIKATEYSSYRKEIYQTDGKNKIRYRQNAHGILLIAEMNKKFSGQTLVVKDKGLLNKFSRYAELERVGLESPEFEKAYEVYSDNQIEARYLLTPVMLEYMTALKKEFKEIEYSFFNKQLLINIQLNKNFFECTSFFTTIINPKRIKKVFSELYLIFAVINTLHLNQK